MGDLIETSQSLCKTCKYKICIVGAGVKGKVSDTIACDYLCRTGRSRLFEYGGNKKHDSKLCDKYEPATKRNRCVPTFKKKKRANNEEV